MQVLTFTIELLEPTLVLMPGSGDANQLESFGYIPGTVLRNVLAAQFIADHQIDDLEGDNPDTDQCRHLFFDEKVRFLNAYPINQAKGRTLPVPLSWQAEKNKLADFKEDVPLPIFDFSHDRAKADAALTAPAHLAADFCSIEKGKLPPEAALYTARRRVAMHNTRSTRRVMAEGANNLFQFEALAEGEKFIGVILAEDDIDLMPLQQTRLSLGKSRSAGYGQAQLTFEKPTSPWVEYEPAPQEPDDFVVVTLLSDALIRDQNGVYAADISPALAPAGLATKQLQPDRSIFKTKLVGGFNRKWNLPLPQTWAVQMGSIFVYSAQEVNRAELARLVESGIAERRAEGFGRIAVDWHRYTEITGYKVRVSRISDELSESPPPFPPLTPHGRKLAQRIVTYQLRRELDVALLRTIADLKISGEPSRSQLSRVRLAARRVLEKKALSNEGKLTDLDTFLNDIQGKTTQQVLQRSRIGSQNLHDWLKSHIWPTQVVQTLAWEDQPPQLLGEIKANLGEDTSLQIEYTARLVEGVIKQELDRQRREGGSNA